MKKVGFVWINLSKKTGTPFAGDYKSAFFV
jgi:hypothetical protein